jgi:hypothetical protein
MTDVQVCTIVVSTFEIVKNQCEGISRAETTRGAGSG